MRAAHASASSTACKPCPRRLHRPGRRATEGQPVDRAPAARSRCAVAAGPASSWTYETPYQQLMRLRRQEDLDLRAGPGAGHGARGRRRPCSGTPAALLAARRCSTRPSRSQDGGSVEGERRQACACKPKASGRRLQADRTVAATNGVPQRMRFHDQLGGAQRHPLQRRSSATRSSDGSAVRVHAAQGVRKWSTASRQPRSPPQRLRQRPAALSPWPSACVRARSTRSVGQDHLLAPRRAAAHAVGGRQRALDGALGPAGRGQDHASRA